MRCRYVASVAPGGVELLAIAAMIGWWWWHGGYAMIQTRVTQRHWRMCMRHFRLCSRDAQE